MKRIRFLGMEKKKMSSGHWNGKYYAIEHGTNSRLDEVHAAILLKKFPYLDEWIDKILIEKYKFTSWKDALEKLHNPDIDDTYSEKNLYRK